MLILKPDSRVFLLLSSFYGYISLQISGRQWFVLSNASDRCNLHTKASDKRFTVHKRPVVSVLVVKATRRPQRLKGDSLTLTFAIALSAPCCRPIRSLFYEGRNSRGFACGPPTFLQHGISFKAALMSSEWLARSPSQEQP